MTHLYRRVTRVWLDSADILDVSTCDDRRPRARSSLWPVGLWPVRVRVGFLSRRSVAAVRSSSRVFPGSRSDPFVTVHPRGCIAATMTTIWRPHWLIKHIEPVKEEVPDDDVPDVKVEPVADDDGINGEDGTTPSEGKGAKRKRAPRTKGPCEHGVKYRSKCKVCSACPHGRRRTRCKECGGCINLRARSSALSVQGVRWGINLRARSSALSVQGVRWECNLRARSSALSVQGVRWGINLRARSSAL